tara:strand:- start:3 stop:863 length:861 start_codon:yes stop_codon:yes gene_type:complete
MINNKYFTIDVEPDLSTDMESSSSTGASAFADKDILFDWVPFEIPKGAARLLSITTILRGTNGAAQLTESPGTTEDIELFFAKDVRNTAPSTLGTQNVAVALPGNVPWFNHLCGKVVIDTSEESDGVNLKYVNVINTELGGVNGSAAYTNSPLVLKGGGINHSGLTGSSLTTAARGFNPGYDRLYVAAFALGVFDFNTGVLINLGAGYGAGASVVLIVDGTDVREVFCVGDAICDASGVRIGIIQAMTHDGTDGTITLQTLNGGALTDGDELFHESPIKFILNFEN